VYSASSRVLIAEIGFVETLIETNNRSGAPAFHASTPAASGIPPIAITPDKVEKYSEKRGVRGMLPLGCFTLWGREGVTLQAAAENKRITGKRGFPMKIVIIRYNERRFIFYHCDERRRPKTGLPVRRFK
jgi:hypothetical protein